MTNRSLYTAVQKAQCFGSSPDQRREEIRRELGLHWIEDTAQPETAWLKIRAHLTHEITEANEMLSNYHSSSPLSLVIVTGEGADHLRLRSAVRDAVSNVTKGHVDNPTEPLPGAREIQKQRPEIEIVFVDDPAFAAARGAAMWQRLKQEAASHCPTHECCPWKYKIPLSIGGVLKPLTDIQES